MSGPNKTSKSKDVYERRKQAAIKRGDKYMLTLAPKFVAYHKHFDTFAARVAREFRSDVIYRRDNGRFAIALVKADGNLEALHKILNLTEGVKVELNAKIYRRLDRRPGNRWVMSIRFPAVASVDGAPLPVPPDIPDKGQSYREGFRAFLDRALLLAAEIEGEKGKRIRKLLELADRLPFAKATNLWHYDNWEVKGFLDLGSQDAKKAIDSKRYKNWRRYPLKGWKKYKIYPPGYFSDEWIIKTLKESDEDAFKSLYWIQRRAASGSEHHNRSVQWFELHVSQLQGDPNHMYSAYK